MKKVFENRILLVIVTAILFTGVGAYAANYYAKDVSYEPTDASWEVNNVSEALNELYNKISSDQNENDRDIIVANYLNHEYTISTTWDNMTPSIYDIKYFDSINNKLIVKQKGKYKIYYQSASDGGTSAKAFIKLLINNVEVASCGDYFARCVNEEKYYVSNLEIGDTIEINAYTTSVNHGARVVVSIVKINE